MIAVNLYGVWVCFLFYFRELSLCLTLADMSTGVLWIYAVCNDLIVGQQTNKQFFYKVSKGVVVISTFESFFSSCPKSNGVYLDKVQWQPR